MIESGDRAKFDAEMLKQLLKLLPEKHEVWPPSLAARVCQRRRLCHALPQQDGRPVAFQRFAEIASLCLCCLEIARPSDLRGASSCAPETCTTGLF